MKQDLHLRVVARTYETNPNDGWVYRIIEDSDMTVAIYRVPEHTPLWGHGLIKQVYQVDTGKFVAVAQATPSPSRLESVQTAVSVILGS
jgi:hypothetical protein